MIKSSTKPKLKVDNQPAPLVSLEEIYNKVGLPFQAYKAAGADSGKIYTIDKVKDLIKDEKYQCRYCGDKLYSGKGITLYQSTEFNCIEYSEGHELSWCEVSKVWVDVSTLGSGDQ